MKALIESEEDYQRAQMRVFELGRPEIESLEEIEQISLSKAMLDWELRNVAQTLEAETAP